MFLENYIEAINSAVTAEDAFNTFKSITTKYGYEKVVYTLITDHPSLGMQKQAGLISSYPEHWIKYYREKEFLPRDPVVHGILNYRVPFYWDHLKNDTNINEPDLKILDMGAEAGLKGGIGIPLFGLGGEVTGLGLASDTNRIEKNYETLSQLYLLANVFHQKYRDLLSRKVHYNITNKEKSVLAWAAESKTDDEIGILMNISVNTVRYHWKNIFRKMEAYGRYVAISKAITMGIIEPRYVAMPYQKR